MRLRVSFSDAPTFLRMIQAVAKTSPKCIIRLSAEAVQIIVPGEALESMQIWSTVPVDAFFNADYRIESNFNNQINLEVATEPLLQALRSTGKDAADVTMRLAKRDRDPLLAFSIGNVTMNGARLEICQEVLIRILKPADINRIQEPVSPVPDVHIFLPARISKLRKVAERMHSLAADHILLSASRSGELKLAIEKDDCRVETTWKDCARPKGDDITQSDDDHPASHHFAVKLDMRSFMRLLSSNIVDASSIIACVCEAHCAIFYVYIGDASQRSGRGVMTFFLPGLDA